ncbi:hypothetical protein DSO57_1003444 [Entomophthora muscae]|uniref:Uncharacterized protein n=1 Tax=Entomophthora muscae TaxID=34485 RepID=A0ACC2UHF2_9FUNG|nr:hypothetical protein DSO57_1003444 [Entomophthora muscae]
MLLSYFQAFGEIDHIKIPPGKGCGFVQYAYRHQAEHALSQLNGVQIGANRVRLSWGRLPADRTPGYRPRWGSNGSQSSSQDGSHLFPDQSRVPSGNFPLFNSHHGFMVPSQTNSPFTQPTYPYLPTTTSSNHPPFEPSFGPH